MPSRAVRDACGAVSPQGRARLPTWPTWPNWPTWPAWPAWPNGSKPARAPRPGAFLEKRAGPGEASPGRQGAAAWACVQGGRPRAGQGTAQAGMRDGQESLRGRACALAGRAGEEDAVYGRPGEAPAPHWKRAPGPLGAGRARRVLVALDGARGRWQKAAGHGGRICRSRRWQALAEGLALIPCHPAGMSGGPRRAAEPCSLRLPGKCPPGLGACGGWDQKKGTCIAAGAEICGGSPETRTPNQLIKSQLLYQLS